MLLAFDSKETLCRPYNWTCTLHPFLWLSLSFFPSSLYSTNTDSLTHTPFSDTYTLWQIVCLLSYSVSSRYCKWKRIKFWTFLTECLLSQNYDLLSAQMKNWNMTEGFLNVGLIGQEITTFDSVALNNVNPGKKQSPLFIFISFHLAPLLIL